MFLNKIVLYSRNIRQNIKIPRFLSDPGVPGLIFVSGCPSLRHLWLDLTDVTLADEDTNSIITDNANRAIQSNMAMQMTPPGGQTYN